MPKHDSAAPSVLPLLSCGLKGLLLCGEGMGGGRQGEMKGKGRRRGFHTQASARPAAVLEQSTCLPCSYLQTPGWPWLCLPA